MFAIVLEKPDGTVLGGGVAKTREGAISKIHEQLQSSTYSNCKAYLCSSEGFYVRENPPVVFHSLYKEKA